MTRPEIIVTGDLAAMSDQALRSLVKANTPPVLFVRSGEIVRVNIDEAHRPTIKSVREAAMRGRLARIADFRQLSGNGTRPVHPPYAVVEDILALGRWDFPPIRAIVETPVLLPSGTVLTRPGYDRSSGLYYVPAPGLRFPRIPVSPTPGDLRAALALVNEAIGEFPFEDQFSRANAYAALLTPIVRPAIIGTIPLGLLDAPQRGTGKGLLSKVIAFVPTGRTDSMLTAPSDDDEWRKRITAKLADGPSIINIDNLEGRLDSASLAAVLTMEVWTDRILGTSKTISVPNQATWLATGNNITLGGDMQRRCYWIRLDAKTAKPWLGRTFKHENLLEWAGTNRGALLAALLTLARAWFAAGRPAFSGAKDKRLGSFESWCDVVGGILDYAGVPGFLGNLEPLYETLDEESAEWEAFLAALAAKYGDEDFTAGEVPDDMGFNGNAIRESLPEKLAEDWARRNAGVDFGKRLGKAFRERVGRRYGPDNLRIERAGIRRGTTRWCVRRDEAASPMAA